MPEGGTSNLQARHHKYKHFCDSTQWRHRRRKATYRSIPSVITIHGLGLVGWHGNTTHAMHAQSINQSHTTKGNEHFRFTHCTRAGVLAPSEVMPFCTRAKLFSKLE